MSHTQRSMWITCTVLAVLTLAVVVASAPVTLYAAPPAAGPTTLIAAMDLEPKTLDPLFGDAPGGPDRYVDNLLYDGLFRAEADGSLTPMLAESWKISEDSKTITFSLRKGVKFHDGTEFNADAAAFNLNRLLSKEANSPRRADVPALDKIEVVDPYTLRVLFNAPSAATLINLAYEAGRMISPTAFNASGKDYGRKPVGTGPYRFVEWRSGDRITFARNPDYWRSDKDGVKLPYIDNVVMRLIPDVSVKMVELRTGNVQVGDSVAPINYALVKAEPSLKLVDSPSGIVQWMAFNSTKPPFNNEKLRTAVLTAIDRDALNKVVTLGLGTVVPSLAAPGEWFYDATVPYPKYDTARAKQLLADAGYPNGIKVTMSIIQREPDVQIGQLMQAQLKAAGVEVELQVLERQAWLDKVLAYNYDMAQLRIGLPRPDPANTFGQAFGTSATANYAGIKDEAIAKLTDDAGKSMDQAKRKDMYVQLQKAINEHSYYAFLFFRPVAFPISNKIQNFPMDVDSGWRLYEVKLAP